MEKKSKPLSQRNEKELLEIFEGFDLPIPDPNDTTVAELRVILKEHGIDNKAIRSWEEKKDNTLDIEEYDGKNPEEISGDVVVGMRRKNSFFQWKTYRFTREQPYVPMSKEEALELVQKYDGFHIATRKEVENYYR